MSLYRDEYEPRPVTDADRADWLDECNGIAARTAAILGDGQKFPGCPACNFTGRVDALRFGYTQSQNRMGSMPCTCTGWRTI